ncbi:MAG: putative transcriptional regulator, partial [Frankiales bacterium]|nr:putative transcriptional regulator [Frankiales bacterium]
MSGTLDQLPRLLALVPYLLARPGVPFATAAADFGVTEERLRKDLNLLWLCGLPGHYPGDLIEIEFEGDTITL